MARRKKEAPTGVELETALLELLGKHNFSGAEHVSVFVVGPKQTPVYIVTLGVDVANALRPLLLPLFGKRIQPSRTEWVLFRPDAEAILEIAENP